VTSRCDRGGEAAILAVIPASAIPKMLGSKIKRLEDPALLRGKGRYTDDIHLPGMLHASFVRSPHAHATIRGIDRRAALALAGVHAVYTLADLLPHVASATMPVAQPSNAILKQVDPYVLADDEVRYVGEAVAVVIADTPYVAEDAARLVAVDYEPLPVAGDCRAALAADAPRAHSHLTDNVVARFAMKYGDCAAAFGKAAHRFRETLFLHKALGGAIECRGVVARHDPLTDSLTIWAGTQMPHRARNVLADLLRVEGDRLRVIAPDVGGGFGPKFICYPEEAVVPLAAMMLGRPVKWIEDRREHFTATTQERDQHWDVEVAVDAEGRMLAVRGTMIHDHGAYTPYGVNLPYNSGTNFLGPYVLPNLDLSIVLALTNKISTTPVRGAGRPQGTFAMERLLDRIARELDLDRAEVRRRNLIQPGQMPYATPIRTRDGGAMTYDSGDYPACMEKALAAADVAGFRARQRAARAAGRFLGLGYANYVEGTGRGPFESALVRVLPSGKVALYTGATDQGQGVATTLAQLCAATLGVSMSDISVVCGDTGRIPFGQGSFASRQAVAAGSSVDAAARTVRQKALKVASHMLEAAEADLEIENGRVRVKGVAGMSIGLGEIARAVQGMPGFSLPGGVEPGMEALSTYPIDAITYCNGTHVAEVEVDIETGSVSILKYTIVHDSGRLINPMIVDGQVTGATAHGIGMALYERMPFGDDGQPLISTLADYLLPAAPEIPRFDVHHMESPAPGNPLGAKGAGEGGLIPTPSAIAAAIEDALAPFGVRLFDIPILPEHLAGLVAAAEAR
jgi:carbon-monoxide dehydrogenase large subunit